jgi:hypothetical protein
MRSLIVILSVFVMLHGPSCAKVHSDAIKEIMGRANFKRQSTDEQDRCVQEKVEASSASSACKRAVTAEESELDFPDESQDDFDEIFRVLCDPDCAEIVHDAQEECGFNDESRDFFTGLCRINDNGDPCYESFLNVIGFVTGTELVCFVNSEASGTCQCRDALSTAVETYGCCLNAYHEFFQNFLGAGSGDGSGLAYVPSELYEGYCDVELPEDCTRSVSGTALLVAASSTAITALAISALFSC